MTDSTIVLPKIPLAAFCEADITPLVLATHNPGKVMELRGTLEGLPFQVIGMSELGLDAPVEDGGSFEANATIKAHAAHLGSSHWALADDSGLCVDALNGLPGVETASYGGYDKLLDALRDVPEGCRNATFVCVLALVRPMSETIYFEGRVHGRIAMSARGEGGFGYDPVFIPDGETRTFAEMSLEEKKRRSHRALALRQFVDWVRAAS